MIRLFLMLLCLALPARAAPPAPVAAAADLRLVLPPIAKAYQTQTGARISLTFGSSGQMVQQALNGAPFQLLLLADASHAHRQSRAIAPRSEQIRGYELCTLTRCRAWLTAPR